MNEITADQNEKKDEPKPDYQMTLDINVLNHLGIGLYSNIPAVVSEVVANSYDADAELVTINIDKDKGEIVITDNGWGMSKDDLNNKFLLVGYRKRTKEKPVTPKGRHVMGRKGIGKLSLFSIADRIEVHSVKKHPDGQLERSGCVMDAAKIKSVIEGQATSYHPDPVKAENIEIVEGTRITLRNLKLSVDATAPFLKRRLARRFSIIGGDQNFVVKVNDTEISVQDRDFLSKIQYVWYLGDNSQKYADSCTIAEKKVKLDNVVDADLGYSVTGWVGTLDEQKSVDEGNNTIVLLAWGKLIHEDILKDMKEGGVYSKYLIGEIRADFLDDDTKEDMTTSDRQSLRENDPRFTAIKQYIRDKILKPIGNVWTDLRNEGATTKALTNPKIKEWYETLKPDHRKFAQSLFGKIETFPISDPNYKKELYKHSILAFQTLALQGSLDALGKITNEADFKAFISIFANMDELEAVHYYQITKGRVGVLEHFQNIAPTARERVIQGLLFDHLWLLDPSWERAATDERLEESVTKEFDKIKAGLTPDEAAGRIDIRYKTAAGKHIIIELKKYDRQVDVLDLIGQIRKYRTALEKCLTSVHPGKPHQIEIICLTGSAPQPEGNDEGNRKMLEAANARYITYEELIQQTRNSYRDYLDKQKVITKLQELIDSI
jgi:hypothetical protein